MPEVEPPRAGCVLGVVVLGYSSLVGSYYFGSCFLEMVLEGVVVLVGVRASSDTADSVFVFVIVDPPFEGVGLLSVAAGTYLTGDLISPGERGCTSYFFNRPWRAALDFST